MNEALKPYFELRGKQVNEVLHASERTGLLTEAMAYQLAGLRYRIARTADPDVSSFRFVQANFPGDFCHFNCMREVAREGEGVCMTHTRRCRAEDFSWPGKRRPNADMAGVSCRGFSTAHKSRMTKGAFAHSDSDLFESWVAGIKKDEPDFAVMENVLGMSIQTSKEDEAPLRRIVEFIERELPQYSCVVIWTDAIVWLVLNRKRLWIHLVHKRAGGRAAQDRFIALLKARKDSYDYVYGRCGRYIRYGRYRRYTL